MAALLACVLSEDIVDIKQSLQTLNGSVIITSISMIAVLSSLEFCSGVGVVKSSFPSIFGLSVWMWDSWVDIFLIYSNWFYDSLFTFCLFSAHALFVTKF